jgi:subtilisin family serine protease
MNSGEDFRTETMRSIHKTNPSTACQFLCVCLAIVVFGSLATTAMAALDADYNYSVLIVKLAPIDDDARKVTLGSSGRNLFDATVADYGVTELHQVFRPLPPSRPNAPLARRMRLADWVTVRVPEGVDHAVMKKRLESLPDVEWVEYDAIRRICGTAVTPSDPYFSDYQYPLRNTGSQPPADHGTAGADAEMEAAWEHTTGDSSVVLAIIDTGIDYNHPELADRIWYNLDESTDGFDEDNNGYISDWRGWNFVSDNSNPDDDHSHGTHCAGIAGAASNNGVGITGMDWQCKLMALKVLNSSGSGSPADVAEAIVYAADNGADVVSMSLGSYSLSGVEEDAVNYAHALGVVIFAAMGNDNTSDVHYPAGLENVIAVGATDSDDNRAHPLCGSPGSNYGDYIDIVAAGDWVWSTVPLENGSYGYKCGTSMATPHAAGLAALIRSLRPSMSPDDVRALMRAAAEDQVGRLTEDTPGFDIYHGYGRINGRITLQALTMDFPPILALPGPQRVTELETLEFTIMATDSNFTPLSLSAELLPNATFADSGNGVGTWTITPELTQQGVYEIRFIADDGGLADTGYVTVTVLDGCLCQFQGDFDDDAFITSLDLSSIIDILFASGTDPQDVGCPTTRGDLDCDGFTTSLDLSVIIDHLFAGGLGPCDPCSP